MILYATDSTPITLDGTCEEGVDEIYLPAQNPRMFQSLKGIISDFNLEP